MTFLANADKLWQDLPEPLARAVQNVWNSLYDLLSGFALGAGELVKSRLLGFPFL